MFKLPISRYSAHFESLAMVGCINCSLNVMMACSTCTWLAHQYQNEYYITWSSWMVFYWWTSHRPPISHFCVIQWSMVISHMCLLSCAFGQCIYIWYLAQICLLLLECLVFSHSSSESASFLCKFLSRRPTKDALKFTWYFDLKYSLIVYLLILSL